MSVRMQKQQSDIVEKKVHTVAIIPCVWSTMYSYLPALLKHNAPDPANF